jgi:hypothetical protein
MGFHHVRRFGRERDGVGSCVYCLDTDHLVPFVGAHVRQFSPWVEDDGGVGVLLLDGDVALAQQIVDGAGGRGVGVDAIGEAGEGEGSVGRGLHFEVVGLVDVAGGLESGDADLMDVGDGEVGVERFFEDERHIGVVGDGEAHGEGASDGEFKGDAEVIEAHLPAELGWSEREGDVEIVACERSEGWGPILDAREAMGRAGLSLIAIGL